jgi:hypothetical protein
MHVVLRDIEFLLIGAAATTTAEFFFHYNLLDYLKDKIVGLFTHKAKV